MVFITRWVIIGALCSAFCISAAQPVQEQFVEKKNSKKKRRKKSEMRSELVCLYEELLHSNNQKIAELTKDATIKKLVQESEDTLDLLRTVAEDTMVRSQLEKEVDRLKKKLYR